MFRGRHLRDLGAGRNRSARNKVQPCSGDGLLSANDSDPGVGMLRLVAAVRGGTVVTDGRGGGGGGLAGKGSARGGAGEGGKVHEENGARKGGSVTKGRFWVTTSTTRR